MSEQHPPVDDLVALALRDVAPEQAVALHEHLVSCGACRGTYAAIDLDVQQVLAAAPTIAPRAGFWGRVLDRMGRGARAPVPADEPRVGISRRAAALLVAAAMVVGALLGVGGTLVARSPNPAPAQVASVPLVTGAGQNVGSAGLVMLDGRQQLVVTVSAGRAGATYECVMVDRFGERSSAGTYTMHDTSDSWVVPAPQAGLRRVELVAASGKVWSSAGF